MQISPCWAKRDNHCELLDSPRIGIKNRIAGHRGTARNLLCWSSAFHPPIKTNDARAEYGARVATREAVPWPKEQCYEQELVEAVRREAGRE